MKSSALKKLPREPLPPEDERVLQELFRRRLRGYFAVGAIIIILILIEAGPNTAKINAAIVNPKLRWSILGISGVLALLVFYRRVWIYRRDCKAGFRYVDRMLVIGKNAPRSDGRLTINLEDLHYHNLEVSAEVYATLQPGDRYPVGFAAYSGLPLTLPGAKALA